MGVTLADHELDAARQAWQDGAFDRAAEGFAAACRTLRAEGGDEALLTACLADLGDSELRLGRAEAARNAFAEVLARQPLDDALRVKILFGLGWAEHAIGRLPEARRCFAAARDAQAATAPDDPALATLLLALGGVELAMESFDEAEASFRRALELQQRQDTPGLSLARTQSMVGEAAFRAERLEQARLYQQAALALLQAARADRREIAEAMSNFGVTLYRLGHMPSAEAMLGMALRQAPGLELAQRTLVSVLLQAGRRAEAETLAASVFGRENFVFDPRYGATATMLCLVNLDGGIPYRHLLARRRLNMIRLFIDYASPGSLAQLPRHDLVFNLIGDADNGESALQRAIPFHAACAKPFLNDPRQILRTSRHAMPALLAGIDDLVIPKVAKLSGETLRSASCNTALAEAGVTLPVLLRASGTHGGDGVQLLCSESEFDEARATCRDESVYLTAFHESALPDGLYRKYRVIFVDRVAYPYHLAISHHWLVHYFSAEMLNHPDKRQEEDQFLDDPRAAIGARAMEAVEAVGQRMDLDYCGMDFSVLPDGRVLLFEANATMLVHPEEDGSVLAAKNHYVERILHAIDDMLDRRLARSRAQRGGFTGD